MSCKKCRCYVYYYFPGEPEDPRQTTVSSDPLVESGVYVSDSQRTWGYAVNSC